MLLAGAGGRRTSRDGTSLIACRLAVINLRHSAVSQNADWRLPRHPETRFAVRSGKADRRIVQRSPYRRPRGTKSGQQDRRMIRECARVEEGFAPTKPEYPRARLKSRTATNLDTRIAVAGLDSGRISTR